MTVPPTPTTGKTDTPTKVKPLPSKARWIEAVTAEALAAGIEDVGELLAGSRRQRRMSVARWRAWKRLHDTGRYSLYGIAIVTGFDHTSIIHGLERLRRMGPQ